MKKIIGIGTGILTSLTYAPLAFAAEGNVDPCEATVKGQNPIAETLCKIGFTNMGLVIGRVIMIVLIIAAIISLFFLIYGGIKWILSGGDKTAVEAARNHIVAAIVGLVISLLAYFIINIVLSLFGINLSNLVLPKIIQ